MLKQININISNIIDADVEKDTFPAEKWSEIASFSI